MLQVSKQLFNYLNLSIVDESINYNNTNYKYKKFKFCTLMKHTISITLMKHTSK